MLGGWVCVYHMIGSKCLCTPPHSMQLNYATGGQGGTIPPPPPPQLARDGGTGRGSDSDDSNSKDDMRLCRDQRHPLLGMLSKFKCWSWWKSRRKKTPLSTSSINTQWQGWRTCMIMMLPTATAYLEWLVVAAGQEVLLLPVPAVVQDSGTFNPFLPT